MKEEAVTFGTEPEQTWEQAQSGEKQTPPEIEVSGDEVLSSSAVESSEEVNIEEDSIDAQNNVDISAEVASLESNKIEKEKEQQAPLDRNNYEDELPDQVVAEADSWMEGVTSHVKINKQIKACTTLI